MIGTTTNTERSALMPDRSNVISHRCPNLLKAKMAIRWGCGGEWNSDQSPDRIGWWIWGWELDSEYDDYFLSIFKLRFCPFCGCELGKIGTSK